MTMMTVDNPSSGIPPGDGTLHLFSHKAMATLFELRIHGEDKTYAEGAAVAVFNELDRLELELSKYIENSDISRVGRLAAGECVRVGDDTFSCLARCFELYELTRGCFDISAGKLLGCWQNEDRSFRTPGNEELAGARRQSGMDKLALFGDGCLVCVAVDQMQLDLGGFGKGYALDKAAELLADWEISSYLLHGGRSSALAQGALPPFPGWEVILRDPLNDAIEYCRFMISGEAVSGSGLDKGYHIVDPRDGRPVQRKRVAWSRAADAATSDALSTAFMIMNIEEIEALCRSEKEIGALVVEFNEEDSASIHQFNFEG